MTTPYVNILTGVQDFCWPKIINQLGHKTILRPKAEGWFCVVRWNKFQINVHQLIQTSLAIPMQYLPNTHTPHLELSSSRYLPIKQSGRHKSGQISKKSLANKDIEFNNNMGQHPAWGASHNRSKAFLKSRVRSYIFTKYLSNIQLG